MKKINLFILLNALINTSLCFSATKDIIINTNESNKYIIINNNNTIDKKAIICPANNPLANDCKVIPNPDWSITPVPAKDKTCPNQRLKVANYSNVTSSIKNEPSQNWRFSFMFHSDGDTSKYGNQAYSVLDITNRLNSIFSGINNWGFFNVYPVKYSSETGLPIDFSKSDYVVQIDVNKALNGAELIETINQILLQDAPPTLRTATSKLPDPLQRSGTETNHHLCRINAVDATPLTPKMSALDNLDLNKFNQIAPPFDKINIWHEAYAAATNIEFYSTDIINKIKGIKDAPDDDLKYEFKKPNYAAKDTIVGGHLFRAIMSQLKNGPNKTNVLIYDSINAKYLPMEDIQKINAPMIQLNYKIFPPGYVKIENDTVPIDPLGLDNTESGYTNALFYTGQKFISYAQLADSIYKSSILPIKEIEFPHMTQAASIFSGTLLGTKNPIVGVHDTYLKNYTNLSYLPKINGTLKSDYNRPFLLLHDVIALLKRGNLNSLDKTTVATCGSGFLPCLAKIAIQNGTRNILIQPDIINVSSRYTDVDYDEGNIAKHRCGGSTMLTLLNTVGLDKVPLIIKSADNFNDDDERKSDIKKITGLAIYCPYIVTAHGLNPSSDKINSVKINKYSRVGHMLMNPIQKYNTPSYFVGAPMPAVVSAKMIFDSKNKSWIPSVETTRGTSFSAPAIASLATMINAAWPSTQKYSDYNNIEYKGQALFAIMQDSLSYTQPIITIGDDLSGNPYFYDHPILNYECVANFIIQKIYKGKIKVNSDIGLQQVYSTLKRLNSTGSPQCRYKTIDSFQ